MQRQVGDGLPHRLSLSAGKITATLGADGQTLNSAEADSTPANTNEPVNTGATEHVVFDAQSIHDLGGDNR